MTQIKIAEDLFSREEEDSIAHVLSELVSDGRDGLWQEAPDEIIIRRPIAGGRSGAKVLEADVFRGNSRSRTVIKIGPFYSLRDECFPVLRTRHGLRGHATSRAWWSFFPTSRDVKIDVSVTDTFMHTC